MNYATTTLERPVSRALPFGGLTDAQLLGRFLGERDEAAFELLVWRHGPMVLRAGMRVLRDLHRAEDVFQATFLTLATKAGMIGRHEAVGSWLYKVAYRLALRARAWHVKQAFAETALVEALVDSSANPPGEDLAWRELGSVLDGEIQKLPEKLRAPFVLCYLQGKTNEEAATELGCPKGTVLSRLARARERLRKRLDRKGLVLSASVLALLVGPQGWASAAGASELVEQTVNSATGLLQKKAAADVVPSRVLDLMKEGRRTRGTIQGSALIAVLLLLTMAGTAAGIWSYKAAYPTPARQPTQRSQQSVGTAASTSTTPAKSCCGP